MKIIQHTYKTYDRHRHWGEGYKGYAGKGFVACFTCVCVCGFSLLTLLTVFFFSILSLAVLFIGVMNDFLPSRDCPSKMSLLLKVCSLMIRKQFFFLGGDYFFVDVIVWRRRCLENSKKWYFVLFNKHYFSWWFVSSSFIAFHS